MAQNRFTSGSGSGTTGSDTDDSDDSSSGSSSSTSYGGGTNQEPISGFDPDDDSSSPSYGGGTNQEPVRGSNGDSSSSPSDSSPSYGGQTTQEPVRGSDLNGGSTSPSYGGRTNQQPVQGATDRPDPQPTGPPGTPSATPGGPDLSGPDPPQGLYSGSSGPITAPDSATVGSDESIIQGLTNQYDKLGPSEISTTIVNGEPAIQISDPGFSNRPIPISEFGQSIAENAGFDEEDLWYTQDADGGFTIEANTADVYRDEREQYAAEVGVNPEEVVVRETEDGITFELAQGAQQEMAAERYQTQRSEAAADLGVSPSKVELVERNGELVFQASESALGDEGSDGGVISSISDTVSDATRGLPGVDAFQEGADEAVRNWSGGSVGISDDWTSTEDSGGITNVTDVASGGYLGDLYEDSRQQATPHAQMLLSDEEALAARQEKDQGIAESAADGGALAMLYTGGEMAERAFMDLGQGISGRSPTAGRGPSVLGENVGDVPGHIGEGIVGGIGMGVGAVFQVPASAQYDLTSTDPTPTEIEGMGDMAVNLGESQLEMLKKRPISTAALFALPAVEAVPAGVRGYRSTRGTTGETVSFSDITSPRGSQGDLPQFETSPGASTRQAVGEVRTRAANQPEAAQRTVGTEEILWHSTESQLGPEFAAARGGSELPGLFTSPDASPLRLQEGVSASMLSRLRPSRPDISTSPDRLAAFEGNRISAMPESATGSGRIRDASGEWVPDPSTSGSRFLEGRADTGTAYVRPTGSRTTELEAILPPGSEFAQTTRLGVEMPSGRTIGADVFRRTGESAESPTAVRGGGTTTRDIMSEYRTSRSGVERGFTDITYATTLGISSGASAAATAGSTTSSTESGIVTDSTFSYTDDSGSVSTNTSSTYSDSQFQTEVPTSVNEPTSTDHPTPPTSTTPSDPTSSTPSYPGGPPTSGDRPTRIRPDGSSGDRDWLNEDIEYGKGRWATDFLDADEMFEELSTEYELLW